MDTIEIRPMDEDFLLPSCLHKGPIEAAAFQPDADTDSSALPPHPWSDDTIRELGGLCATCREPAGREFMREMIHRYGTCALLAWEGERVVGFLRFYPMKVARLMPESGVEPILDPTLACEPQEDEGTLWVYCVMTSQPYTGAEADVAPPAEDWIFRTAEEAGARKGIGLRLAKALIPWAKEHGWQRIVKVAHPDLDIFYGLWGGGGKAFWQKAGFQIVETVYKPQKWSEEDLAILRAQAAEKEMTEEDVWTCHRMAYEV